MNDLHHIQARYFPEVRETSLKMPSRPTRFSQHQVILKLFAYHNLRQCVQKALNRGEAYHRLRRAVAFVNDGKFRVKIEAERQIWNECPRFITNAIIYYNTVLLLRIYEQKQAAGDQAALSLIEGVSPVAWQNVNLFGSFEFNPSGTKIDMDAMVARFADPACWSRVVKDEPEPSLG